MSRTLTLVTLMLAIAVALAAAQDWEALQDVNGHGTYGGSALCAGAATEPDGVTRTCVWMLHGLSKSFERYDVTASAWTQMADISGDAYVDWGGALAYVPNPWAWPTPSGWVFAFKGGGYSGFLCVLPTAQHLGAS